MGFNEGCVDTDLSCTYFSVTYTKTHDICTQIYDDVGCRTHGFIW
jgi:hypothetical protein